MQNDRTITYPEASPVFPQLFHSGHLSIPTQGVLVALGLLAALQLATWLAPRLQLSAERVWSVLVLGAVALFAGTRLLVVAFNLSDFIQHPFWMLGLTMVRDERFFYGGALPALLACLGYVAAYRLPLLRTADCLAPAVGLSLAFASLGDFAAGSNFGQPASAALGVVYTNRLAMLWSGTPLGIPLLPIALYACALHLLLALIAVILTQRSRIAGETAALWLFTAGLGSFLLEQLRYRFADEPLLLGAFSLAQGAAILAVLTAGTIWLRPRAETHRA